MTLHDTIVAVSTPLGSGPRAILRLSGDRALDVALRRFRPREAIPPQATYRSFDGWARLDADGLTADIPASLLVMRGPRSYTRQDVVELHVPGSPPVVEALMATLCAAGARPAGPGEFTARAFAAGRLDLAQAEAVMAVIAASGRRSLAAAQRMLQGQLSAEVNRLADRLRSLLARVELAIDFSEEGEPLVGAAEVARETAALRDSVVALARRSRDVAHLDGDVRVALVGRPNVGKSSLFNRLAGANRAIVTDVAGTTRDELRESFMLAGSRIVLSDTAGLEDALAELNPRTAVSRAAQERTLAALARADLVLVVTESARMRREAGARHDAERLLATLAAPAIVVLNKSDLDPEASQPEMVLSDVRLVTASALTGQGLDELRSAMVETLRLGDVDRTADGPAVSSRHRRCLELASEGLTRALDLCVADRAGDGSLSEDLVAMELRESLDALGGITGRTSPEDVLDEVFSRFCIGK